ncbi:MAG TPA: hypothetical protein VF447_01575 [Terriglobales bacterium]
MKKLLFPLGLSMMTAFAPPAFAQVLGIDIPLPVVVKDTRQYSPYAQATGIKPPVVGGEWEIRVGEFCREEAYGPGSKKVTEFKCDDNGNPV